MSAPGTGGSESGRGSVGGSGRPPLGVILAGGGSERYGSPKALAPVHGVPIIRRVRRALERVTPDLALSANQPDLFADVVPDLPSFPDERPELGPLAGIHAALLRARREGRPGVLAVACDMPFPCVALLERLRSAAFDAGDGPGPDLVVPESRGRRGIEPLFAAYGVACVEAIEGSLAAGDRRMIGFHERVEVARVPLAEVESLCDPGRAFLNVNTPGDRERAEAMAETDEGEL